MLKELDDYIKYYEEDTALMNEYWQGDGIEDATEILNNFTENDWQELINTLPSKSDVWKKRLTYCLYDKSNPNHLQALASLANTDNLDLFEIVLSFINRYDLEELTPEIIKRIQDKIVAFLPNSTEISNKLFNMFLKKKINEKKDLKIFTDNIDETAKKQITKLLEQDAFKNSKIRIMPDVHAGNNCVIGFTGDLGEKVIPSIVGGDIGCGMFCANLGKIEIDYKELDDYICQNIPSGTNYNSEKVADFDLSQLYCYERLKHVDLLEKSLGTLGGGNHFIEIDESQDGEKYLVIHTGSRNLGAQVANYYQNIANQICNYKILEFKDKITALVDEYKNTGRVLEIKQAIQDLKDEYRQPKDNIPYEYTYLEGPFRDAYLHDMKLCQEYAKRNRQTIAEKIAHHMLWNIDNSFESVHNYISEDNIVRKGAISAKENEPVIIPINMRDGCIIGVGKGNTDWNNSAPHGAGRIMSRKEALDNIDIEEYRKSMANVYTSSVNEDTKDESPFVYKKMEEIMEHIEPTVEITKIIKPTYNYKASEVHMYKKEEENSMTR